MQQLYNLYNLRYEIGAIYSIVLLLIGFVSGIVVWRWYRGPGPAAKGESDKEVLNVEDEVQELATSVSELWEKTQSPSIEKRTREEGKKVVFSGPDHSLWRRFYWRIFGGSPKRDEQRADVVGVDGKCNAADAATRIQSQTDKIRYVARNYPFRTQPPPTRFKPSQDLSTVRQPENEQSGELRDQEIGSQYAAWQQQLRNREKVQQQSRPSAKASLSGAGADEAPDVRTGGLVHLYNNAVSDSFAREQFREHYQPIRIGTINAVERRQNPTALVKAEFRETSDGDFFALRLTDASNYAVVPRLGLTIGAVSYNAGALGEMFGNPPYDPAQSYSRYRLVKPALFKREGEHWVQEEPGALDLGPGD